MDEEEGTWMRPEANGQIPEITRRRVLLPTPERPERRTDWPLSKRRLSDWTNAFPSGLPVRGGGLTASLHCKDSEPRWTAAWTGAGEV